MAERIKLRKVTADERQELEGVANARTAPAHLIQRARLVQLMLVDSTLSASKAAHAVGFANAESGISWVKRFNANGMAGLEDQPRSGRPRTHAEEVHSQLIALALQKPRSLGYPFALWTLERLQVAFHERHGVHLSDSTIWTWLDDEGLKWRRQQSWFQEVERHDPEFAEKRGPSSSVT